MQSNPCSTANGNSIVTQIDVLGHEPAVTDALGHTRTKYYDSLGRLAREVDATGYQTVYSYDVFDRRTTVTDGLGALTAIEGDHTTVFHYDQRDRTVQVDQAQGWHLANDPTDLYEAERILVLRKMKFCKILQKHWQEKSLL